MILNNVDHEFRYSAAHWRLMAKYYKGYLGACDHPGRHPWKKPYYAEKPITNRRRDYEQTIQSPQYLQHYTNIVYQYNLV